MDASASMKYLLCHLIVRFFFHSLVAFRVARSLEGLLRCRLRTFLFGLHVLEFGIILVLVVVARAVLLVDLGLLDMHVALVVAVAASRLFCFTAKSVTRQYDDTTI